MHVEILCGQPPNCDYRTKEIKVSFSSKLGGVIWELSPWNLGVT